MTLILRYSDKDKKKERKKNFDESESESESSKERPKWDNDVVDCLFALDGRDIGEEG